MTPRFRTAFSVPSGFSAATPKVDAASAKAAGKGASADRSGRRADKTGRKEKARDIRGSEAA